MERRFLEGLLGRRPLPPPGVRPDAASARPGGDGGWNDVPLVNNGVESALEQARAPAGEKDVSLGGGANVVQQYLVAGLLDEMVISVVPILLGGGARLFDNLGEPTPELRQVQAVEAPGVTHIRYVRAQ
jgi:dihydrofolate reductase